MEPLQHRRHEICVAIAGRTGGAGHARCLSDSFILGLLFIVRLFRPVHLMNLIRLIQRVLHAVIDDLVTIHQPRGAAARPYHGLHGIQRLLIRRDALGGLVEIRHYDLAH